MWKSILKQLWNRRRSNAWIAIELLFVFCLTWYIVDWLFVYNYNLSIPTYRDVNHTLQINVSELPPEHPEYRTEESEGEALLANYQRLIQVIKDYPGVEAVAISYGQASPGAGSYWGMTLHLPPDTTRLANGQRITIDPAYDFFRVFHYTANKGKKQVSTADFDWGVPNGVVTGKAVENMLVSQGTILGKELETWNRGNDRFVVIGLVDDIKRFDYDRPQGSYYVALTLAPNNVKNAEISIRHQASLNTRVFRDRFKTELTGRLRIGNFYLLSVIPYSTIADNTKQGFGVTNEIKLRIYMMIFFLLNTLLCMMGAFWYRINQRPNEIGLRKAVGATERSIHFSLILEGIFLLLLITIPAMIIEYQFVHTDLIETVGRRGQINTAYLPDRTLERFLITNVITLAVMAVTVTVAIWLPARKGASLAPAEALHCE
ncbi:hypothetical protein LJB97_00375 [Parabacteroides sp. OttesenSCG-928-O15]|nr:hypothetical protein [Parabacteroides sp. OttesenSCG-928-O15]